jgi:hypothetical protein
MIGPASNEPDTPGRDGPDEGESVLHRLLRRRPTPEQRLAAIIDAHRRDLDEQRARFEQTVEDLERREQLLSDAKASVERLLRLGSRDLDARETDLARLIAELTEREQRLREEEAALARRRSETGAVELRRVRVEQQERALEDRERALEEREARSAGRKDEAQEAVPPTPRLAFVPGAAYRLVELDDPDAIAGRAIEIEGELFEIARIGRSPLPGDDRRCAYLVRGLHEPASGGSS